MKTEIIIVADFTWKMLHGKPLPADIRERIIQDAASFENLTRDEKSKRLAIFLERKDRVFISAKPKALNRAWRRKTKPYRKN